MKTDSMTIDNKELNNVEATKEQTRADFGYLADLYEENTYHRTDSQHCHISNVSGSTVSHR